MAINLATLRKLEAAPASELAQSRLDDEPMVVLVRLRKGSLRPGFVSARGEFSPELFSAEITASDLRRLEADPAVESVSIARELPNIR